MSPPFSPLPVGFVQPCLPTGAKAPPSGKEWLHEIKQDGFRVIARKVGERVKLYSRPGNDLTRRFPLIVQAVAKLRASSCIIDGEAVACAEDGIACFELLLVRWDADGGVFLYAFDLIELDGDDLRHYPLIVRKTTLASLVARAAPGLRFNEHIEAEGIEVFNHACKLGLEGIVSKRKESRYRSGRLGGLDQEQEPECTGSKARSRDRLEPLRLFLMRNLLRLA
jgi:bifunctional non-homologous end joining protein LigD